MNSLYRENTQDGRYGLSTRRHDDQRQAPHLPRDGRRRFVDDGGRPGKFAVNIQQTVKGESTAVLSKAMTEKMLTPFGSAFDGLGLFIDKRKDDIYFGHGGWTKVSPAK